MVLKTFIDIRNAVKRKEIAKQKETTKNETIEDDKESQMLEYTEDVSIQKLLKDDEKLISRNEEEFTVKASTIQETWRMKRAKE